VLYIQAASRWGNRDPDQRNGCGKRPNSKWDKLMPGEKAQNLQDTFLNHVRKSKTSVTIFLVNGVKLQGFVTWFDNFCVLLRRDGHSQLVYKHAISTIMPASPIQMFEAVEEGAADHH
jgi:host factor-I protein